jgi:hypothetical protein
MTSAPSTDNPTPATPTRLPAPTVSADFDAIETLLRLLVGATSLGADELLARARDWEKDVLYNPHGATRMPDETPGVRARYALIGLVFLAGRAAHTATVDFTNYSERQANAMYHTLSDLSRVPVLGILARPMKVGVDALLRTRDRELERWIRIGRIEERDGRRIAALGTEELVQELILRISENDKLRDSISTLVQQQSLDMTGEAVDSLRQGTMDADARIERVIWKLLGRTPRSTP